ncbi:hypothetical protein ABMC88_15610 [Sulfitobacter sp. HNIBRBA2951]|uniref:hypothetical protein n=2 Tax=Sulfitobacter TaxID=60136 RepID=UPI0032DE5DFE
MKFQAHFPAYSETKRNGKMKLCMSGLGLAILALGGCADLAGQTGASNDIFIKELPEGVLEIAAPFQDLNAVKIEPTDGCFVYRYVGPVETTYLPLRSKRGNPICSRPQGVPATG